VSAVVHPVEWRMPSPLWESTSADDVQTLLRPALLRFASDSFMADLARLLAAKPSDLKTLVAKPLTFRLGGKIASDDPEPALDHLKLYQPAHGDFYLVAASLVCRIPGLPDRTVDAAAGDRIAFVLRRLDDDGQELAWVDDPTAPKNRSWLPVADATAVATDEDLLPMFPVNFDDVDVKRRLLVGFIPTASKESYIAGGTIAPLPTLPADTRYDDLETKIVQPLAGLIARKALGAETERVDASRFVLLDLAQLLADNVPQLWKQIMDNARPDPGHARNLYDTLAAKLADTTTTTTWRTALVQAWQQRLDIVGESGTDPTVSVDLAQSQLQPDDLRTLVKNALPTIATATAPAVAPVAVPKLDPRGDALYVLRCVYLRPQCGPLHPPVVSGPSEEFSIAGFFDFDAPARDIQITLPADTSVKDLRKFQRNVKFLISDQLRNQLNRVTPLKDMSDEKLAAAGSVNIGWICSFSLPIITICALLVLYIFLSLLNIIFWWLPFVKICLPLPLKGR
jgi:hypothetical protein